MSAVQVFWKHCGKRRNSLITSNFSFSPQYFLPVWRTVCLFHQIWNFHLQTVWVWKSLIFVIWEGVKQQINIQLHYIIADELSDGSGNSFIDVERVSDDDDDLSRKIAMGEYWSEKVLDALIFFRTMVRYNFYTPAKRMLWASFFL